MAADEDPSPDTVRVELRLPAESAFVTVVRTAAAGLAARQDLTLDEVEDLRVAVGEAAALAVEQADPGALLLAEFLLGPRWLEVVLTVPCAAPRPPAEAGFTWQVLSTLATAAAVETTEGSFAVRLRLDSALTAGGHRPSTSR